MYIGPLPKLHRTEFRPLLASRVPLFSTDMNQVEESIMTIFFRAAAKAVLLMVMANQDFFSQQAQGILQSNCLKLGRLYLFWKRVTAKTAPELVVNVAD
jgi:hypothetical protein